MSKRLLALNVVLVGLSVFFGAWLVRDLAATRALPSPPAPRKAPAAAATAEESPAENASQERLTAYNGIVSKYLFNPTRAEGGAETAAAKPAVPLPPKPLLLGVVVDGKGSRAYLEDPSTKRVFSYQVGDSVAGGKLEKIGDDRVQISRTDGAMDVMLRDPAKPKPPPPPPTAATPPGQGAQPPGAPAAPQPPVARTDAPQGSQGRQPIPPRSLRRVPAEQQATDQ